MALTSGTRIQTYEIVARLGAGAMGEVYRARDAKLNRDVAIKVLPDAVAGDPDRLARFDREARALAALNHPNIAHVYDSGTAAAGPYVVLELVPGEDLSALILRGPLPVAEALAIAAQIVEGLAAAHDAGIVHRDLKPANIKVRHDGIVKVLDFGLAKAVQASPNLDPPPPDDSTTLAGPDRTEHGVIMGTAAYMSPEQARGQPVDRRTDIWAFGAILYEMLTGRRAFGGGSTTDVLSAVLGREPEWSALPPDVPPAIRSLLRACLVKDRARRIGDISTARFVIETAAGAAEVSAPTRATARSRGLGLAAGAALLVLAGFGASWALLHSGTRSPAAVARYSVTPAEGQEVADSPGVDVALSPDGSWMVCVGRAPDGGTRLLRRNLEDLDALPIPGSEGARAPVISPDGGSIAFVSRDGIRTLPVAGGPPFTVVAGGNDPAWGDDGHIYYGGNNVTYRVPARGGEPVAFTTARPNILQQAHDVLPGGRGLLLTLYQGTPAQARIAVVGPEGGAPREILTGTMARFASTGHIIYATARGALLAAPFDLQRLEVTGPSAPLSEGVAISISGATEFAVSRSGALLYATGAGFVSELVWVTREGLATSVDPAWTGEFGSPALSPDGRRVAVAIQGPESMDIWISQLDRGPRLRLTLDSARNDYPVWTPDGRGVTFTSDRAGPSFDLWTKRSDGSGDPVLEIDEKWAIAEALWSPDGKWFLHRTSTIEQGAGDVLGRPTNRSQKPIPVVASRFMETAPAISPNGRWLAYASRETGRSEIFVVPFPNAADSKWPVSVDGGSEPLWSPDGRELFYRRGRELMSVRVETERAFSAGAPTVLFSDPHYTGSGVHRQYDVTPDGQRFIMVRPVGAGRQSRLILVRNALSTLEGGASR